MTCDNVSPCTREADTAYFWQLMRALTDAERRADPTAALEALDDLDVFTLLASPSAARTRAAREVSRRQSILPRHAAL